MLTPSSSTNNLSKMLWAVAVLNLFDLDFYLLVGVIVRDRN